MTKVEPSSKFRALAGMVRVPQNLYIDGEISPTRSGETFDNINPATAQSLGQVAAGDAADLDHAVKAGRSAFNEGTWSRAAP